MAHRDRRGDRQVGRRTARPAGRDRSQPNAGAPLRRVLYRDSQIIVIDKPAGFPVHAGPRSKISIEPLLSALTFGLSLAPIPAHRLDHDTSGCLILARNARARGKLGRLFEAGRIEKVYWAIVKGTPSASVGRIELPLRKVTRKDGWRVVTDPAGQSAVTDYKVLGRSDDVTWLELRPRTGRTHQIRVHCAALNFPVVGDSVYGAQPTNAPLHLFSRAVTIPFYEGRPAITVVAPPPPHMLRALSACGFSGA